MKKDYVKAEKEWEVFCKEQSPNRLCAECKCLDKYPHHNTAGCFAHWLMDKVKENE